MNEVLCGHTVRLYAYKHSLMHMTAIGSTAVTASCSRALGLQRAQRARGVGDKSPVLLTQCFMEAGAGLCGDTDGNRKMEASPRISRKSRRNECSYTLCPRPLALQGVATLSDSECRHNAPGSSSKSIWQMLLKAALPFPATQVLGAPLRHLRKQIETNPESAFSRGCVSTELRLESCWEPSVLDILPFPQCYLPQS